MSHKSTMLQKRIQRYKQKRNMMFKIFKMIKVGYGKGTNSWTTIDNLHVII
jgi:hypothetical protein